MKNILKFGLILMLFVLSISLANASNEVLNLKFDVNDDGSLGFLSTELSNYEHVEGDASFEVFDLDGISRGDALYNGDLFYERDNLALFLGNANWDGRTFDAACYTNLPSSGVECLYVESGNTGEDITSYRLIQEFNDFNSFNVVEFEKTKKTLVDFEQGFDVFQNNELITNLYVKGGMIEDKIFVGTFNIQNLGITDGEYFGACYTGGKADCYITLKEEFNVQVPEPIPSLSGRFCDYLNCEGLFNVKLNQDNEVLDFVSMTESTGAGIESEVYMNLIYEGENKGNVLFSGNWILDSNGNEYFYGDSDIVYNDKEYNDVLTFCRINYPFMECGVSLETGENVDVLVANLEHIGGNNLEIKSMDFEEFDIINEERVIDVYDNNEKIGTLTTGSYGYFIDDFIYFGEFEMDDGGVTGVYDGVCEIGDNIDCYVALREEIFNEVIIDAPNTGESNNYDSGSNSGSSSGSNDGSSDGGSCYEEWECGEWTECSNGVKTRSCWEVSLCGTDNFRPDLEESCEIVEKEVQEDGNLITGAFLGMGSGNFKALLIGLAVLVVGGLGSMLYFRRKNNH